MRFVRDAPSTEPRALEVTPRAQARTHVETHGMSRYKDLALRLAVVASFVLVLAAPFRW
jgi:hypothetical protein